MSPDEAKGINKGVNPVKFEAKFEELQAYFLGGGGLYFLQSTVFCSIPVYSVALYFLSMAGQGEDQGRGMMNLTIAGSGDGGAGSRTPEEGPAAMQPTATPATPTVGKGRSDVGGPSGLALTTPPNPSVGFTSASERPPPLRRHGKAKMVEFDDSPIVIDMEAMVSAVKGKLAVGRVLSPYPANPSAVVNELKGPWRLRGDARAQMVTSIDKHFVVEFTEEGDRQHVLAAGPWHFHNDAVIFADFDGQGNPAEVDLNSIRLWAQIHKLPFVLKTEEMGWTFGKKLGKVIAVSHRNKMILDEHLRIRVVHKVDTPLKKEVGFTPLGSKDEITFKVKYEKLPNFCFCCGILGHTTERFCSMPKELRKPNFSIDMKAPPHWKRFLDFGSTGAKLSDRVISAVSKAVRNLSGAGAGSGPSSDVAGKVAGDAGTQEGLPAPPNQLVASQVDHPQLHVPRGASTSTWSPLGHLLRMEVDTRGIWMILLGPLWL